MINEWSSSVFWSGHRCLLVHSSGLILEFVIVLGQCSANPATSWLPVMIITFLCMRNRSLCSLVIRSQSGGEPWTEAAVVHLVSAHSQCAHLWRERVFARFRPGSHVPLSTCTSYFLGCIHAPIFGPLVSIFILDFMFCLPRNDRPGRGRKSCPSGAFKMTIAARYHTGGWLNFRQSCLDSLITGNPVPKMKSFPLLWREA